MNEKLVPSFTMGQQANFRRHWLVFAFTLFLGLVVCAGIRQSWGEGFGAILIPAAIGYFLVKGGKSVPGFVLRYSIFMAVLTFMVSGSIIHEINQAHTAVEASCLTRNSYTAQLTTEKRTQYCQCMSDNMDAAIVWSTSTSFLSFQPLTDKVQDIPELITLARKGANQCAALVAS